MQKLTKDQIVNEAMVIFGLLQEVRSWNSGYSTRFPLIRVSARSARFGIFAENSKNKDSNAITLESC